MDKITLKKQITALFPALSQIELVNEIVEQGQFLELPAKYPIMKAGDIIQVIPIVFSGSIKVIREGVDGKAVFLYYIRRGESCALTLSSCLQREKSQITAITEEDSEVLALPVNVVYDFVHKYPSWNDFVIKTYSNRFDEMLNLVDNVCFKKIDTRLVRYLLDKKELLNVNELVISHQEIAKDLATSREVISRLLKNLEKEGGLIMSRGKLTIMSLNKFL